MTSRLIIAAFAIVATLHSRPATAETALITGANRGIGLEMARQSVVARRLSLSS